MEELASPEGVIRAVMEGEQTKTSVTDAGSFTWSTGDQVWLQTTNGSVVGTLSSGAGSTVASFSHGSFIGELTGKATYPYNAGHSVSSYELTFVLPASYDLGTNLTNTNAAMYGVNIDGTIRFSHLAGVMRFIFKNAPAGTDKFRITLDKKISGTFKADLTADYPILETSETTDAAEKTITLNFDALTSDSDISLYVPLPVGTYTTLSLDLWAGEKSVWTYSNTVTNTISRKTLKLMPVVTLDGSVDGELEGPVNLSEDATANSYIVSEAGSYKFTPAKGNSSESVGAIASAEVLWETFGTDVTPNVGDLVKNVKYENGVITFKTPDAFKEGNAVIAAKDAAGTILWSWHIWLTDQPEGQEYYNNAGTMMDRNLGATSATPGDVGALGLLYQWGRKDPFLGSSSISSSSLAESTITWPSSVESNASIGNIAYATANPTTFITYNASNLDWYYTGSSSTDDTRWTTSETSKSMYDPCPAGWRVPDGGDNGVWSKAVGSSSYFSGYPYDSTNEGMNFSGKFGSDQTIWYPASGFRSIGDGSLGNVGYSGYCWSASPSNYSAYYLRFNYKGSVDPSDDDYRANGHSVRCLQESPVSNEPDEPQYMDLSEDATANSYIVSEAGSYKFTPTKGNSSESVGAIASAEVLWETFGTDVTPSVGDLVKDVKYENGVITFKTPDVFKEGNAVIAAKDANGTILWSWHIWLTDQPEGQVYYNNAGTMMDRNLGATSATPGDVGALGLLYQWGRKDPFLGSSSIHYDSMVEAKSTITWPSAVPSDTSNGTIAYATANPTTFITRNSNNHDWYYTGSSSTDDTRWTTSETSKSMYDPCPAGWRVPDGGANGVWSKALGSSSYFYDYPYDSTNEGMNFSGKFGSASIIWYPASGYRGSDVGSLCFVGHDGGYWSASPSPYDYLACSLNFRSDGHVGPSDRRGDRTGGPSVRCLQESSVSNEPEEPQYIDLSEDATANSYIVSESGSYKFTPTKGNSNESVGAIASAEVLWESFGTDVTPSVGDLVKDVKYESGVITFKTPDAFKEGNAVIAAKDAAGTILWSWHIWLTDQPEGQVYYNNAGTMMDRNLGATSATPGDVGALGLWYQWGRKDPFLGSSSISSSTVAKSTITWPSAVFSDSSKGTIAYATANPTTFIKRNDRNYDWYYKGLLSTDNTRWTTSESNKSIYDPCPAGWRVPDGGDNGVWSKAVGSSSYFSGYPYDSTNEGMNFSGKFGSASTIWYPASGFREDYGGSLYDIGIVGFYWSASPYNYYAYRLSFDKDGYVSPSSYTSRPSGLSVRCLQEIDEVAEP